MSSMWLRKDREVRIECASEVGWDGMDEIMGGYSCTALPKIQPGIFDAPLM